MSRSGFRRMRCIRARYVPTGLIAAMEAAEIRNNLRDNLSMECSKKGNRAAIASMGIIMENTAMYVPMFIETDTIRLALIIVNRDAMPPCRSPDGDFW